METGVKELQGMLDNLIDEDGRNDRQEKYMEQPLNKTPA